MSEKVDVIGKNAHPFYKWAKEKSWNCGDTKMELSQNNYWEKW